MNLLLTPQLIKFLKNEGYNYCLCRTSKNKRASEELIITLYPTRLKPDVSSHQGKYETYFDIDLEPTQMAEWIDDTLVLMDLNTEILLKYIKYVLFPINAWKSNV